MYMKILLVISISLPGGVLRLKISVVPLVVTDKVNFLRSPLKNEDMSSNNINWPG